MNYRRLMSGEDKMLDLDVTGQILKCYRSCIRDLKYSSTRNTAIGIIHPSCNDGDNVAKHLIVFEVHSLGFILLHVHVFIHDNIEILC
jgi:hypothetical protein